MPFFGFDEQSVQRITRVVKRVEQQELGNVNRPPGHRLDAPIPMFLAKLDGTIAASCSGQASGPAIIWGTTQASTALEASLGTSETVYDWFGTGGSSSDKVMLFREFAGERLYFMRTGSAYGGLTVGAVSLSLGAGTIKIPFATAGKCSGVTANTSDNRLEIGAAGTYVIDWAGSLAEVLNVADQAVFTIYKNGSSLGVTHQIAGDIQNEVQNWSFSSPPTELASGDYIELFLTTGAASGTQTNGMNIRVVRVG